MLEVQIANCYSKSSKKITSESEIIQSSSEITFHEEMMKTLSFGGKLAFLSQYVLHFHVFDDYKKKDLGIIRRIRKSW